METRCCFHSKMVKVLDIMSVTLFVMFGIVFILLVISNYKRVDIKQNLDIAKQENSLLKDKIKNLEYENGLFRNYYQNHTYSKSNSEEVKEAVRYAMKKSHPDNGGSAKDFDRFRKLYNSMK